MDRTLWLFAAGAYLVIVPAAAVVSYAAGGVALAVVTVLVLGVLGGLVLRDMRRGGSR